MTNNNQGKQPKVIYQLEADELERIISRVVTDAMERYTSTTTPAPAGSADLMTRDEVSKYLGVTLATLHNWHKLGYLTSIHIGRGVRYRRDDVEAFALKNHKR